MIMWHLKDMIWKGRELKWFYVKHMHLSLLRSLGDRYIWGTNGNVGIIGNVSKKKKIRNITLLISSMFNACLLILHHIDQSYGTHSCGT